MTTSLLEHFLVTELFAFLLIFTRIGTGIMTLPGFGEAYVPLRVRLHVAIMISVLLVPVFGDYMPDVPGSPLTLTVYVVAEVLVGLFIGFISRILITTMHFAGSIISYQSSLAMATIFDISQGGQSTVIGNFLTLSAVVLFFVMDLHHIMLSGLADSYSLFRPGEFPVMGDVAQHSMMMLSKTFAIALQLAAPHIVFALLYYLGSGVLARLMPTMHVFFVLMPTQILIAFFLLLAVATTLMVQYTSYVEESLRTFLEHY